MNEKQLNIFALTNDEALSKLLRSMNNCPVPDSLSSMFKKLEVFLAKTEEGILERMKTVFPNIVFLSWDEKNLINTLRYCSNVPEKFTELTLQIPFVLFTERILTPTQLIEVKRLKFRLFWRMPEDADTVLNIIQNFCTTYD